MTEFRSLNGVLGEESRQTILTEWCNRIKEEIPLLRKLDTTELIDGLRRFLSKCAEVVAEGSNDSPHKSEVLREAIEIAKEHGSTRASVEGFCQTHVLTEFRILRELVLIHLDRKYKITNEERESLLCLFDIGITYSGIEFAFFSGGKNNSLKKIVLEKKKLTSVLEEVNKKLYELEMERKIREQFVQTLTHDLRTPLTAVKVSADLMLLKMKRSNDYSMCVDLATRISDAANRTDKMIRDLLDANQIRAGEAIRLSYSAVQLEEVMNACAKIFVNDFHRIKVEVKEEIIGVWDVEGIRRILENLIGNAIKYGDDETVIGVRAKALDGDVIISVENQGTPIPESKISTLFDPFKREDNVGIQRGWGLGLTVVKGLTEAHNGTISVTSTDEKTVFSIKIPRDSSR